MTFKMEGRGDVHEAEDKSKDQAGETSNCKIDENSSDAERFARERNLLLLSTLYRLYGEEWSGPPDWSKVADEIKNAEIPVFCEGITAEWCESQYKSLIDKGYQVGIADIVTVLKSPKRLTEVQKRIWILAATSNDIVATSKAQDLRIRFIYKQALKEIDELDSGKSLITYQEMVKSLSLNDVAEEDLDPDEKDVLIDPSTLEVAEVAQHEVNEQIVGFKDVLLLWRYCNDAVESAMKTYVGLYSQVYNKPSVSQNPSPLITIEFTKSTISNNKVSDELSNLVHAAIANTTNDDKPKVTTPASTAPTLSKLLELPITAPGMPLPDIPSVDQSEKSPEKPPTRNESRGNSKERTLTENVPENSASEMGGSPKGNGEQPKSLSTASPAKSSPVRDTNGQDAAHSIVETEKSPSKSEHAEKSTLENSTSNNNNKLSTEKQVGLDTESKVANSDTPKSIPSASGDPDMTKTDDSESTTASESSEAVDPADSTRQESPTKGKQAGRKSTAASRQLSRRTSSRIVSPEPTDQPANEEEKSPKKGPSRQTSSSDAHTPSLRSRRGATPTKAGATENEHVKSSSSTAVSKLDFTSENDDETFETPRSTPESPEMKSDTEITHETKPPKQLKVYAAKPPSPLSHVDPKLFEEEFDEEDDPELVTIDSNVNKSKGDKGVVKSYSRRGRTVSSENASDVGNNEDAEKNKRVTRKVGISDDMDDGDGLGSNEDSKRLTRSSLKLHDAANDEGAEAPQTESEKAASESSFGGKEKKPRTSKSMLRLKNLQDEKSRVYGEGDETPEGKRLTRARAKTSVTQPEKRSKPPSVGDSEGVSESEPTPTRATRSRSSTASSMPVLEPTSSAATQQPPVAIVDDEEFKLFRRNVLGFLEKITSSDIGIAIQKHSQEDPFNIVKCPVDFGSVKSRIESGKIRTLAGVQCDLYMMATNTLMANPNSSQVKESATSFYKFVKSSIDEFKNPRTSSSQRNDNSDVESLESHDEQRSEASSSKQTSSVGRRKRKRSASETSEEVLPQEKRRVTRTSTSYQQSNRKPKHAVSPDIVYSNRRQH